MEWRYEKWQVSMNELTTLFSNLFHYVNVVYPSYWVTTTDLHMQANELMQNFLGQEPTRNPFWYNSARVSIINTAIDFTLEL